MNRNAIWLLLLLLSITSYSYAQQPDYSGRWVLNFEKSTLQSKPDGLTGSIFLIRQNGNKIKLTRYHVMGSKQQKIGFKMRADGKTRRIKILFKGKLEWKQQDLLATLWRKNFSNIVKYKLGNASNELIAEENFSSPNENYHNVWVFEREVK